MDLKESITTAMEEINRRRQVTSNDNESTGKNLSKEEKDFYQSMFANDIASVRHRKLHCTACDKHIGSAPAQSHNMYAHPILLTLLCDDCFKFYGDGNFEQGEDATDMFCRWCANGGNLYCCSYCSNTFCNKCIKRNCDPLIRRKIEDEEKWKCFVCDPTDLYTARAVCWALLQHVQTVTRILRSEEKTMPKEEFTRKMNLDECKCCVRKRKAKRRRLSGNESEEEDETYHPGIEEAALSLRRSGSKKSLRRSSVTNGDLDNSVIKVQPSEAEGFDDDDDLPPPMIPCVQLMVEGDSSETLNETLNSHASVGDKESFTTPGPPPLHINPIPTASLMKVAPPVTLTPVKTNTMKRKRAKTLQHILPAPTTQFLMVKKSPQSTPNPNVHTIEYSSLPLRAPTGVPLQPNVPMVAIPATGNKTYKPTVRVLQKIKPPTQVQAPPKEVRVIELDSDSDDYTIEQTNSADKVSKTLCRNQDILKNMLNKNTSETPTRFPEPIFKKKSDKTNRVEDEIDMKTEEVRMLFRMIGTKLKKVPLLHLPNHNKLRSTRVKTRRFHLAIAKAITELSDINDKVVHTYSSWRTSMLLGSRQTRSNDVTTRPQSTDSIDVDVPLDMICTNSDSESDNETYDSDEMFSSDKLRSFKSFQERDTVDVGVGESVTTADKSVQVYDVVDRDYEKCIGHSVLTKVVYDPTDGSEILKPVIVPAENEGKFEEQFIFYLQHREENEVETDDDLGLPDPNETPLKDLIEANSPFVLEMLESIADSPLANGMIPSDSVTEASDESGKENEDSVEPTNVVKELAKIVTELSEDLKTSNNKTSESLANKNCENENSKKDRRKQVFEDNKMEHEEVDIAVQTLIEEDERSRSSSNDEEATSRTVKQLRLEGKTSGIGYSEDECTIID